MTSATEQLATIQAILDRTPHRPDNRSTARIDEDDRLQGIAEDRAHERRWGHGDVERAERDYERARDRPWGDA